MKEEIYRKANAIRWNDVIEVKKGKKAYMLFLFWRKKGKEQFFTPMDIIGKSLRIAIEQGISEFVTTANL